MAKSRSWASLRSSRFGTVRMGLAELSADNPYPNRPQKQINLSKYPKWFDHRHEAFLPRFAGGQTKLIVELGSWVGHSTRWWCMNTPAKIVCIDHWKGSAEHSEFDQEILDDLYDAFALSCWAYRGSIIPLRMNTVCGMLLLAQQGIQKEVDLVYVDASHQYEDVITDIEIAYHLFPNATLIGDDYIWRNPTQDRRRTVMEAVQYFTSKYRLKVELSKRRYLWAIRR